MLYGRLFDEKLLEAIRLAEALQDGRSEEKESEGKKTEVKQETENSRPVSRTEEPVACSGLPQTGEEASRSLIKEIVQETQEEIAAEGIQTEDIRKEFFQKKAEKSETGKEELDPELESRPVHAPKKLKGSMESQEKGLCDPSCCCTGCDRDPCRYICQNVYEWKEPAGRKMRREKR